MEIEDREPTIIIITPDNPAGAVNAVASVDESGLPERGGEPEGTLESQSIETHHRLDRLHRRGRA